MLLLRMLLMLLLTKFVHRLSASANKRMKSLSPLLIIAHQINICIYMLRMHIIIIAIRPATSDRGPRWHLCDLIDGHMLHVKRQSPLARTLADVRRAQGMYGRMLWTHTRAGSMLCSYNNQCKRRATSRVVVRACQSMPNLCT